MSKSARDKNNEYTKDLRDTQDAIDDLENASRENYGGNIEYAFRVLSMAMVEAISELPKARGEAMRGSLLDLAQKERNEYLTKLDPDGVLR